MATANIYLIFNGDCEAAFNFYSSVFEVGFGYLGRFSEMPESEQSKVSDAYKNQIMHVSMQIGNSVLMGSDCGEEFLPHFVAGNNFSVSVSTESREETEKLFSRLAQGGSVTMALNHTFWGDYFGMLTDKFGINWMISFNETNLSN